MTCALLLLLLLSQAEGLGASAQGAPASALAVRWHSLARAEASTLALLPRAGLGRPEGFMQVEPTQDYSLLSPEADGTPRPGALASLGLGVDNAR